MQRQCSVLFLAMVLAVVGCASNTKSKPEPGSLEAVMEGCRQSQTNHYIGTNKKQDQKESDEIVPYRVYEGKPIFSYQGCMKSRWGYPGAWKEFEENEFPWEIGEQIVK